MPTSTVSLGRRLVAVQGCRLPVYLAVLAAMQKLGAKPDEAPAPSSCSESL